MTDQVDLMISNAARGGWIVRESGEAIAAFSTISELCSWLESEYRAPDSEPLSALPRCVKPPSGPGKATLLQHWSSYITGKG